MLSFDEKCNFQQCLSEKPRLRAVLEIHPLPRHFLDVRGGSEPIPHVAFYLRFVEDVGGLRGGEGHFQLLPWLGKIQVYLVYAHIFHLEIAFFSPRSRETIEINNSKKRRLANIGNFDSELARSFSEGAG